MNKKKSIFFVITILTCFAIMITSLVILLSINTADDESSVFNNSSNDITSNEVSILDIDASEVFSENSDVSSNTETDAIYHGWVINNIGYTYFYKDSAYEQFNYKTSALDRYVNSVNNLSSILPDNISFYNIIAPVSGSFAEIPRDIYVDDNFYNASQATFVSTASSKLNEGVINVPIISLLEEQYDNGEYIFFRSDKNWTAIGAYTAYKEFCKSASIEYHDFTEFEISQENDFLGCFYNSVSYDKTDLDAAVFTEVLTKSPDSLTSYKPYQDINTSLIVYDSGLVYDNYTLSENSVSLYNAYDAFLGKDAERYEINTTAGGGNLLIIGDTSAYPMAVFLASHYGKIDIINPLKFKGNLKEFLSQRYYDACINICYSTSAINGEYIPNLNKIIGENNG